MIGSVSQKESFRKITPTLVGRIIGYVARLEVRNTGKLLQTFQGRLTRPRKEDGLADDLCQNKGMRRCQG